MKIKLKKPLDHLRITQLFGQNANRFYKNQGMKGHSGIDFGTPKGTPIKAAHDGTCIGIYHDKAGGIGVDIGYDVTKKNTFKTRYWHIMKGGVIVKYNQKVKAGDVIAMSGSTGLSTGPHLHFALKEIYQKNGYWRNKNQDNGYFGGIDPMPYLDIPVYEKFGEVSLGHVNDGVAILQALLMAHGYEIKVDRVFGRNTKRLVKKFQKKVGLKSDGIVGSNTWKELYKFNNK